MDEQLKIDFDARHQDLLALREKSEVRAAFDGAIATIEPAILPLLEAGLDAGAQLVPGGPLAKVLIERFGFPLLEDALGRLVERKAAGK